MFSPIYYPCLTYGSLLRTRFYNASPLVTWLAFGKLPENVVVTPNATTQVVTASTINKFLQSVTVNPIPTTPTP